MNTTLSFFHLLSFFSPSSVLSSVLLPIHPGIHSLIHSFHPSIICLSVHLFHCPSTCSFVRPSIFPFIPINLFYSIYLSVHPFIILSIHLPDLLVLPSIPLSVHSSVLQYILCSFHSFIYSSVALIIHPLFCPSILLSFINSFIYPISLSIFFYLSVHPFTTFFCPSFSFLTSIYFFSFFNL